MENVFIVIDGNSLINRAYYAMQRPMITKEGIYTQGIYGFLNMLNKVKEDYNPKYISVCFDRKEPTFRHKEYSEYKAGRKGMPPELLMEMPILKDILHAMNIKTLDLIGYEADDLIGTLTKLGEEKGLSPIVVTGDKDALQLASDKTKILFTKKGVTDFDLYDDKKMVERYGLTPTQFIDLKGIMGDSSDNIPGILGIGEKGGIELLTQFGSLENMLENTSQIKKEGLRKKVEEHIEDAKKSKWLATIVRDVPICVNLDDFKVVEPNYDELINLYTKLEFNSFLKKLNIPKESKSVVEFSGNKEILTDINKLDIFKDKEVFIKVYSDFNHTDKPSFDGIVIMDKDNAIFTSELSIINKLNQLNLKIYGHNLKDDLYVLLTYGFDNFTVSYDTEIMSYVIDPTKSKYDLNEILVNKFHISIPKMEDFIGNEQIDMFNMVDYSKKYLDYGIILGQNILTLIDCLDKEIKDLNLSNLLNMVELPLIRVMANMEVNGIKVDSNYLVEFGKMLNENISQLEEKIYDAAKEKFNIKSNKQLGVILFEKLNLEAGKKNKSGYSTSAEVLEKLKDKHEIIPLILEYRNLTKLESTYVTGMKSLIGRDGKIHAHFNQTVTQTGRISCTEPNLQNIPVRQELGRKLRKAFLADTGYILIGADYSQIELRVLAHLSNDDDLINAFNNGEDIHKLTASRVLNIPLDKVTSLDRSRAKAVNFGVIYGMSSFGLSEELGITRKDAEEYISEYFYKHPMVKKYMDSQKEFAKLNGYSLTILNRRRLIPEINASQYIVRSLGERLAMNTPIQGSAADIIKLAMIKVDNELRKNYPDSKLILQVHDELIINAKKEDEENIKELLRRNMEEAYKMKVKLEVSMNASTNWYDLK